MKEEQRNITFAVCNWEEIATFSADYIRAAQISFDSYCEDRLLECKHYKMTAGERLVGCFSIGESTTIRQFFVVPEFAELSQELFARVKKFENVSQAMVHSGDELFLSHCFDAFERLEKQAYLFEYSSREFPAAESVSLRLADLKNTEDLKIIALSGDFFEEELENAKNGIDIAKIYVAEADGHVIGFGIIQYGVVITENASIGMFVCEEFRQRGYAGSILRGLRAILDAGGYRVISGCWYYNHNSKKSIQSAGGHSKSRLLHFYF